MAGKLRQFVSHSSIANLLAIHQLQICIDKLLVHASQGMSNCNIHTELQPVYLDGHFCTLAEGSSYGIHMKPCLLPVLWV